MPSLMSSGDSPSARCSHCGATTFAVCLACVKRGGRSLAGGYRDLLLWLAVIVVGLAALAALVTLLRR